MHDDGRSSTTTACAIAPASDKQTRCPPEAAERMKHTQAVTRIPDIIVGVVAALVIGLSLFYLLRSEPLLVQGEADATRFDIAARVDGRVKEIPVKRGQDVAANAVLVRIDNPETVAKLEQMKAAKAVADAQLANVLVGTRVETIAARKAEMERAQAALVLTQNEPRGKPDARCGLTRFNDVISYSLCLHGQALSLACPPLLRAVVQPVERLPDLRTRDHSVAKAVKASPSIT